MTEHSEVALVQGPEENSAPPRPKKSRLFRVVREFIAITVWIYVLVKLFVFDFDVYLVRSVVPALQWVVNFKFLILLGIVSAITIITRKYAVVLFLLYTLFYPLILVFFRIPFILYKLDNLAIVFYIINSVVAFFQSFKYRMLSFSLYIISFVLILVSYTKIVLYISMGILLLLLASSIARRFIYTFKTDKLFKLYKQAFTWVREKTLSANVIDDAVKGLPVARMSDAQIQKWTQSLEQSVLINRIFLFTAKKIREYKKSSFGSFVNVSSTILLWLGIVVTFGAISIAAYKIDPTNYTTTTEPTLFMFFHYSFKAALFTTINEITAVKLISQSLQMIENFFALLTVAIFMAVLISVRTQQFNQQLDDVISALEREGAEAEAFVRSQYQLTIDAAMAELEHLQSGLIKILLLLTRNLK